MKNYVTSGPSSYIRLVISVLVVASPERQTLCKEDYLNCIAFRPRSLSTMRHRGIGLGRFKGERDIENIRLFSEESGIQRGSSGDSCQP
jgi:hypothetical protein